MSWRLSTLLLFLFTVGWLAYVAISYISATANDCSYIQTEACRVYMRYVPQLMLWRGATIQLLAVVAYLWFRKR